MTKFNLSAGRGKVENESHRTNWTRAKLAHARGMTTREPPIRIVVVFGKPRLVEDLATNDFTELRSDIAKTRGLVSLGNEVQRVRIVFKYA